MSNAFVQYMQDKIKKCANVFGELTEKAVCANSILCEKNYSKTLIL